jgi:hypothetical protein
MLTFVPAALGFSLALLALAGVMTAAGRGLVVPAGADLRGVKSLGVAVELSNGRADFVQQVGVGTTGVGVGNRRVLRRLQYWDLLFIASYTGLFWTLGRALAATALPAAGLLGGLTRGFVLAAATFDLLEDIAILRATRDDDAGQPIRRFGLPKWIFFYLAVAASTPLFAALPTHRPLAWLAGLGLAAGGLAGLTALAIRRDGLVEKAAALVALGLLAQLIWLGWELVPVIAAGTR